MRIFGCKLLLYVIMYKAIIIIVMSSYTANSYVVLYNYSYS